MRNFFFILLGAMLFSACKKVAGEGGTSSIKGKIHVLNYNSVGTLIDEYDGAKENVYIIYGDGDNTYDDHMDASYDGTFEFKYLEKGSYKIFVYEDCATCGSGDTVVIVDAQITDRKQVVDVGTINIKK